jgi:hypothetical protein
MKNEGKYCKANEGMCKCDVSAMGNTEEGQYSCCSVVGNSSGLGQGTAEWRGFPLFLPEALRLVAEFWQ